MLRARHLKQLNKKLIFRKSRKEKDSLTRLSKFVSKYAKDFELLHKE